MEQDERSINDVLKPVYETLGMVDMALEDLGHHDPQRKRAGIRNLAVWGRSVTFALQKAMRNYDAERFNPWYEREQDAMRADEVLAFFHKLRNEIEKE